MRSCFVPLQNKWGKKLFLLFKIKRKTIFINLLRRVYTSKKNIHRQLSHVKRIAV